LTFAPFHRVLVAGRDVLDPTSRLALTTARGRVRGPRIERVVMEARGPLRATVRMEGAFRGVPCRFVARLCFFAGTGLVRIRFTIRNPNRARHQGGLWDLGDPGSLLFRSLAFEFALAGQERPCLRWTAEPGQRPRLAQCDDFEIYQDSSGGENWRSKNHVNREGRVPATLRGYRVRAPGCAESGLRANPAVALAGSGGCLSVAIAEFWQQFPKAIEVEERVLRLGLFPRQHDDLFELQGGEQKTHTVWLHVSPSGPESAGALEWVHEPARLRTMPAWVQECQVYPHLGPVAEGLPDDLLESAVDGASSFFSGREIIDEYGWRHYGDVYADHEATFYKGPAPVVSHYNNQYDVLYGALFQYQRTGNERWFDFLAPLARHIIDIDIYHTDRDRSAYNGGLFWHTDHYRDAATCSHRSYSVANCGSVGTSYGGGPANEHNYTTGLLHYYYLTGDPLARDTVLDLADWVIRMDDGGRTVLGLFEDGPTGRASCTRDLHYQGPGRGAGNSINALLDAWLLSGQRCYLEKAEELIQRCIHPLDDVVHRDLLNVEDRWSYTVFLSVLARYLDLKVEFNELDRAYAYAQASLVHYAAWMRKHEQPYLDQPEKLEYPTEVWAAQDLRKANVLRLAARHVWDPERSRLLERGAELADRAWKDLLGFTTRDVARARALVMIEGTRDAYLRAQPFAAAPRPVGLHEFGLPQSFIPQQERVFSQLRSVAGCAILAWQVVQPRTWWRLVLFLAHGRCK
jgi:hypothetical protein